MARANVVISAVEAGDLKASHESLLGLALWMNWWLVTVRSYAISSSTEDVTKTHQLLNGRE